MLEDEDDWMKVATADGYVGYIKTKFLKNQKKEKTSRDFTEPVYSDMTEDHSINMAWHNVTNAAARYLHQPVDLRRSHQPGLVLRIRKVISVQLQMRTM